MKILDSNLWVFGTLRTNDRAVEVLEEIERGETSSAINAYMVQEALAAFQRTESLSPAERDATQTAFLTRLTRMTGLVEAPSSRDVADSVLDTRRSNVRIRLLARILDIQPKDVPILVLAFEHEDHTPAILTNDGSFATLEPSRYNLSALSIEHVE